MSFEKSIGTLESAKGSSGPDYVIYTPKEELPRAVVQVVFGFNENVETYEGCGFVDALTSSGYVVCFLKLRGFVPNGTVNFGDFETFSDDISALFAFMRQTYRRLPLILYGHDFGSLIVRDYIAYSENNIDGAIISGTWDNASKLGSEKLKTKFDILIHGKDFCGKYNEKKVFGYNTVNDVKYYYSCSSYLQTLLLLEKVSDPEWSANVPLSLPVLLVSGSDDAFENEGNGTSYVYSRLEDAELCELKLKRYDGCEHAPHFGSCKDNVFADITAWIGDVCQGVVDWGTLKI